MNARHRADRLLGTWLQLEAPASPPPELFIDITARTSSTRPRPTWLARLEGHHMDVIQGGRRSATPRLGLVIAIIGLLLAALAIAFVAGQQPQNTVVAPTDSASSTATETVGPTPTAFPRAPLGGDPIPDELLGTWWESGRWVFILRGPDPNCVAVWGIKQDCLLAQSGGGGAPDGSGTILTVVDDHIRLLEYGNPSCRGETTDLSYVIDGDKLTWTILPQSCYTEMLPLIRAGGAGAPSPAPTAPSS